MALFALNLVDWIRADWIGLGWMDLHWMHQRTILYSLWIVCHAFTVMSQRRKYQRHAGASFLNARMRARARGAKVIKKTQERNQKIPGNQKIPEK